MAHVIPQVRSRLTRIATAVISAAAATALAAAPADADSNASFEPPEGSTPLLGSAPLSLSAPDRSQERAVGELTVTVRKAAAGKNGTFRLRCRPNGGNHPDVKSACERLERAAHAGEDPFAPARNGSDGNKDGSFAACTMQYGGPATARIRGTWAGRRVDARYDRSDGCQISRWNALVPVLPAAP